LFRTIGGPNFYDTKVLLGRYSDTIHSFCKIIVVAYRTPNGSIEQFIPYIMYRLVTHFEGKTPPIYVTRIFPRWFYIILHKEQHAVLYQLFGKSLAKRDTLLDSVKRKYNMVTVDAPVRVMW